MCFILFSQNLSNPIVCNLCQGRNIKGLQISQLELMIPMPFNSEFLSECLFVTFEIFIKV